MGPFEYVASALWGTSRARAELEKALASNPGIGSGLEELRKLDETGAEADDDAPIFLLSAGWRSGSTLLQRLIMSDPGVLLWGEPYDECGIIPALAGTVKAFRSGWPPREYYFAGKALGQMSGDWIANLFPDASELRRGHRAFFEATFAAPARRAGATRWGIKEVRLDVEHARYLRWLFPGAKFVFLIRNPLEAYRSYCRYGRNWYDTWPAKPVFTPRAFGAHWRKLTEGFIRNAAGFDALVVRYEDLVTGDRDLVARLGQHLNVKPDPAVLTKKVGSSERSGGHAAVSRLEKTLLRRAVSPLARELGYVW